MNRAESRPIHGGQDTTAEAPYPQWYASFEDAVPGSVEENDTLRTQYTPVGLQTREEERNELGTPSKRAYCYLCTHVGEYRPRAGMGKHEWTQLMDMIRKAVAHADPINLAIFVSKKYARIRHRVNQRRLPHEDELPPLSPATVLDHIRNHNTDPEIQLWLRMTETLEMIQTAAHASREVNGNGEHRLNKDQVKAYGDLVKLYLQLAAKDPSKMAFYSNGAHLDMKTASSGPISLTGKHVMEYWGGGNSNN